MPTTIQPAYGTRTQFSQDTALNSLASAGAVCVGAVDNGTTKADGHKLDLTLKLATTGVTSTGTVVVYLHESTDGGTTYADGINVTSTGNQASSVKNAPVVRVLAANANSQTINVAFDLPAIHAPKNFAIVVSNGSGATLSSTGHSVYYTPITYTQS